jgi:Tol biopolymer transport system component
MRGELDWIVMKTLEKDRNRRYETANGFAADVQRYLNDEPVQACPPSAMYRLRKLVRRNKGPVLAASLLLLALLGGIIGTTRGMLRATVAEAEAVNAAQQKEHALTEKETALSAARQSEQDAREQLFLALLNEARARRFSHQLGQRMDSLDVLAKAAAIHPDERLRDEAIAALGLPDIRRGPSLYALPAGRQGFDFDGAYQSYARINGQGLSIRSIPDDEEIRCINTKTKSIREVSMSPNGQFLTVIDGQYALQLWRVADGKPLLREELQPCLGVAFSPDNRQLAVAKDDWVVAIDMASGQETNRWRLPARAYALTFHPHDQRLAVGYSESPVVSIYDAAQGRLIADLPVGSMNNQVVAWHPDGDRVSFWGTTLTREVQFLTVPLVDGDPIAPRIADRVRQDLAGVSAGRFVWARSRRHVYFEGRAGDTQNVWRITIDPATEAWIDGPERLTTGAGEETNVALSPDGTRLLFTATSSRTRLWSFPFDPANGLVSGEPNPISNGSTGEVDFDARADGSKVAYRTFRAGRSELWERSVSEGRERLLLSSADWGLAKPLWSPDGARLAFMRWDTRDKTSAVALLNADGTGERVLTSPRQVEMQGSDWSKDGRAILGACRFSEFDLYSTCLVSISSADQAGASMVQVLASDPRRNLFNQRFSPDQRWITFLAHDLSRASTSTVYVAPAAGGTWRAITDGTWFDDKPRWGPDGRVLYFVSNRTGGVANVWGRRFDGATGTPIGDPFPVTTFRSAQFLLTPRTVQMDIAITATRLLLPMTESRSDIWMLDQVDR